MTNLKEPEYLPNALLSKQQAASYLGISKSGIERLLKTFQIVAVTVGMRRVCLEKKDLDNYRKRQRDAAELKQTQEKAKLLTT